MRGFKTLNRFHLLWISLIFIFAEKSKADLYLETAFGMAQINSGSNLYGDGAPSVGTPGAGASVTLGQTLLKDKNFELQFMLQSRYSSSSGDDISMGLLTTYPALRIELSHLYLGFGYTPYVWSSSSEKSLSKAMGANAMMGEIGFLWKMVPFFYVGIGGGIESVSSEAGSGPNPVIQATILFRFFLSSGGSSGGGGTRVDGWRYPFGIEL